ncbi:MAG: low molecular weight phosphotyrosine protein phosphatase [Spirochaetaceae bacterium]|nr:MAG: low molecular weight phosphotyrosine protein phosphatase [Spirochaetaceae bacterium]
MKVMFVCMGNICRSPVAHAVFEYKVKERGLQEFYEVESSGTHGYHVGEDADPRMRKTAGEHGVPFHHSVQKFNAKMLDEYDLVLTMDQANMEDVRFAASGHPNLDRVRMFRTWDPKGSARDSVPDPYYGGDKGFEDVFLMVERTCEALLNELESKRVGK